MARKAVKPKELAKCLSLYKASIREGTPMCPVCFGTDLHGGMMEPADHSFIGSTVWPITRCRSCGAVWREVWELKRLVALIKEEEKA